MIVTTATGSNTTSIVTLSRFAPSFILLDTGHVSGIILRSNGSGAFGKGKDSYDVLGPTGSSRGYPTVAAQPGDTVELFGVGFGTTIPAVPAGKAFTGAAPINNTLSLYVNNVPVKPTFVGLSSAGLYQINLTLPDGLGDGDVPIQAIVGGMQTQPGVLLSLQNGSAVPIIGSTGGGTNPGNSFSSGGFGGGGGTGGNGGGGGTGGNGGGVYASLEEETALREVTSRKSALGGRSKINVGEYPRMTYVLSVATHRNLELAATLQSELANVVRLCLLGPGHSASQELAGIWISEGIDSVVFPSATGAGRNVAVYLANAAVASIVVRNRAEVLAALRQPPVRKRGR